MDHASLRDFYLARGEAFLGPIEGNHVNEVIADLIMLGKDRENITLVISSPGGITSDGFRLASFIEQELKTPVVARVWDLCCSAATYALLCCAQRSAHPEARFVLHRQTTGIELRYSGDFRSRIKEWQRDADNVHKKQVRFYSRKLGLPKKKVEKILLQGMGFDAEMSAKKALKLGLITEIIKP